MVDFLGVRKVWFLKYKIRDYFRNVKVYSISELEEVITTRQMDLDKMKSRKTILWIYFSHNQWIVLSSDSTLSEHIDHIARKTQSILIILIVIFGLDSFPVCWYYQMENLTTFLNKSCIAYIASYTSENRFHGLFLLEMRPGHGILVVSLFASSIASIVQLLQKNILQNVSIVQLLQKTQYFAKCNIFPSHPVS